MTPLPYRTPDASPAGEAKRLSKRARTRLHAAILFAVAHACAIGIALTHGFHWGDVATAAAVEVAVVSGAVAFAKLVFDGVQ